MTFVADAETRERKLRGARMAAASAVGNGCSPDDVRDAVEQGIREAQELEQRTARPAPAAPAPRSGALSAWGAALV